MDVSFVWFNVVLRLGETILRWGGGGGVVQIFRFSPNSDNWNMAFILMIYRLHFLCDIGKILHIYDWVQQHKTWNDTRPPDIRATITPDLPTTTQDWYTVHRNGTKPATINPGLVSLLVLCQKVLCYSSI